VLLTSIAWLRVFGSTVPQKSSSEHYMDITTIFFRPLMVKGVFAP